MTCSSGPQVHAAFAEELVSCPVMLNFHTDAANALHRLAKYLFWTSLAAMSRRQQTAALQRAITTTQTVRRPAMVLVRVMSIRELEA